MSAKLVIVLALLGGAGWALTRSAPPAPVNATAADSAVATQAGLSARFHYGIGMVGVKLVRTNVRNSVFDTETSLKELQPVIKKTRGGNGLRAKAYSQKVRDLDSQALMHLEYGQPIKALKAAMDANSLLGAVRSQIKTGI